jgi:spermidine synthase
VDEHPRVELIRDLDRPNAWVLAVDGVAQSYVDLDDPTVLDFEYVRLMADVVEVLLPAGAAVDAVHLGGGGCTLPRYLAATRRPSRQLVFEADPEVADLVGERLGLDTVPGVALAVSDARDGVASLGADSADLVVCDVFEGPTVPARLLTLQALTDVARVLRPAGVLVANIADQAPFDFARPVVATLRAVFTDVALLTEPGVLRGRRFGNIVLVAAPRRLDELALVRRAAAGVPPARVVTGAALTTFVGEATPATDDAPATAPSPPQWSLRGIE